MNGLHNCFCGLCKRTHSNDRALAWRLERTRTGAFVILPADELSSANKKRGQCELPLTTDFDAPLRTQTIITDKITNDLGMKNKNLEALNFSLRLRLTLRHQEVTSFCPLLAFSLTTLRLQTGSASARQPRKGGWIDVSVFVRRCNCNSGVICTVRVWLAKRDWPEMLHT